MKFRPEVRPFLYVAVLLGAAFFLLLVFFGVSFGWSLFWSVFVCLVFGGYMLFFFRDPEVAVPDVENCVLAAANGKLAKVEEIRENTYLKTDTIRISIFLSLLDVHVNRFPIEGRSTFLGYFPGKRLFTFDEKSSDVNQHNAVLVKGRGTSCLIRQIVGPVCRRVVYWPDHSRDVAAKRGARFGMMKFGSRLDMYFPKGDIELVAKIGDKLTAGETIIARIVDKNRNSSISKV